MPQQKIYLNENGDPMGSPSQRVYLDDNGNEISAANRRPSARELADIAASERRTWTDTAVDALPAIGGTVGGVIGAIGGTVGGLGVGGVPGGIGGAAIGGAGGEGIKKTINYLRGKSNPAEQNVGQDLKDIAYSGAKEGVIDAAGAGVGKFIIQPAAKAVVKKFFDPGKKAMAAHPGVVTDLIENGIAFSEKGTAQAKNLTDEARRIAVEALQQAEQQGARGSRNQMIDALYQNPYDPKLPTAWSQASAGGVTQEAQEQVTNQALRLARDNPPTLTPTRLDEIRGAEQGLASKVYEGAPHAPLQTKIHADTATGAKHELERIVPGQGERNATTRENLITQKVAEEAVKKHNAAKLAPSAMDKWMLWRTILGAGAGYGTMGPAGIPLVFAAERLLGSPRAMTAAARGAYKGGAATVKAGVRAGDTIVNEDAKDRQSRKVSKAKVDALYKRYEEESR